MIPMMVSFLKGSDTGKESTSHSKIDHHMKVPGSSMKDMGMVNTDSLMVPSLMGLGIKVG